MPVRRGWSFAVLLVPVLALAQKTTETIPVQALPEQAATASTEKDANAVQLEAVTVTSSRLARKEGAESVRVVTRKEIEQSNARDLYELFRHVANVSTDEGKSA